MESASYKIQFDSINTGGGLATSSSYILEDTAGEIATGDSESASYRLHAGYQQMNESFISISTEADVNMPSISGILGDTSNASSTWTVTTDNVAGYELSIKASTSPAMQSSESNFPDYSTAGSDPDFSFAVAATTSAFGFTPEGVDVADRFKDNGSVCNAGSSDTADACWDGFSTTDEVVSRRTSANHTAGTETTIKYRAESGSSNVQTSGSYQATITVTAIAL